MTGAGEAYALLATTVSDAAGRYVLTTTLTGYDLYRVGAHPATDAAGLARAWSWSAGASCGAGVEAALCFEAPPPGRYAENHFLYRERAAGLTVNACATYTIPEVEMTTWVAHSPYPAAHYVPEVVVVTKYYYHGGRRVALRVDGDPEPARNDLFYLHLDHLGSTSSTTDEQRHVAAEQRYYPYGAPRQPTGDLRTDYGFTGQRRDAATTLMYYGARYYDPALGRFVSADTIVPAPGEPQSLNRYTYGYNNPVKYSDPNGHMPALLATALLGGVVGGSLAYVVDIKENLDAGLSFDEALTTDIEVEKIAAGFVGGFIAGGTLGLAPATVGGAAGLGLATGLGALGGVAGGQAAALTEAGVKQCIEQVKGQGLDGTRLWDDARQSGWGDPTTMRHDAFGGAVAGGVGYGLGKVSGAVLQNFGDQTFSSGLPVVRFLPGQGGLGTTLVAERTVTIPASGIENTFKGIAGGTYDLSSETLGVFIENKAKDTAQWMERRFGG